MPGRQWEVPGLLKGPSLLPPKGRSFDLSPPPVVEDPERFYRSWLPLHQLVSSFSCTCKKRKQKKTPVSRVSCASSNRPMTRRLVPPCGVVPRCGSSHLLLHVSVSPKLARVLIPPSAGLRASLRPAPCLTARCLRYRPIEAAGARGNSLAFAKAEADSDSPRALFRPPRRCSAPGQREIQTQNRKNRFQATFEGDTKCLPIGGRSLIYGCLAASAQIRSIGHGNQSRGLSPVSRARLSRANSMVGSMSSAMR
jgi:hypothetical protein